MSQREIAALALRLLGVYCMVTGLPYIVSIAGALADGLPLAERLVRVVVMLLPGGTLVVVGLLLLAAADPAARLLVGRAADTPLVEHWTSRQVQGLAFSVLGAYLVATSLPGLLALVGQMIYMHGTVSFASRTQAETTMSFQLSRVAENLLQLALGVWLFLGARGFSNLWHRLRTSRTPAGRNPENQGQA